ncbi:MAG: T9SS C-terminal target domain-containing protein [Bacteroidetes bacterium]|nr:MAG: T9SS C-terminal target domain-containing protein [Bacteroidota bacterium]
MLKADSVLFALLPAAHQRQVVVANQTAALVRQVSSLTAMQFTNYALAAQQGTYIIISNKWLFNHNGQNPVQAYADYRRSAQGGKYKVLVAEVDELADQFCYGIRKHPIGIKNFVRYALANFSEKPQYVLLLGRGTDYLSVRYTGISPAIELLNSVPTWGSPGSDNLLVSASGLNPTPLVPIGRISATNGAEIETYLQKVKQFEALQAVSNQLPADGSWRKHVLQLVGGNDVFLSNYIGSFMTSYAKIVSDSMVGALPKTYRRVNNSNLPAALQAITETINTGASIITYFGHTSNSSIDFGINNPDDYAETRGKYPVFLANGCRAGNIFDLNRNRLVSKSVNLSDNFIFTPNKGAIAFISNSDLGVIGPLDAFTRAWYRNLAQKRYGQSLGNIQIGAIQDFITAHGLGYFDRVNSEQVVLHGDPAVRIFTAPKPDYSVAAEDISILPMPHSVAEDSLMVVVKFSNLGAAIADSVWVEVSHEDNTGLPKLLTRKLVKPLKNVDSLGVVCPVRGMADAGANAIVVRVDADNAWEETDEGNNTARKTFEVSDAEIRPVYPYAFALVNTPNITLTGSTANPLHAPRNYRLQVDTTEHFNSPLLFTADSLSAGGAISFAPAISWTPNTVYYWRMSPLVGGVPINWQASSFNYVPGPYTGFGQSHYFQHQKSLLERMNLTANSRSFSFAPKPQSLYAAHGIYGYSGSEDSHFSFSVNGIMNIYSACVGQSLIFNLFDPVTFAQRKNLTGEFGSGPMCGAGREYNFEFPYFPASNRKKIMDFIDQIPKGTIVAVRAVVDPPYDSLQVRYWKRDTTFFGPGRSLYHSLYDQGFKDLDSLSTTRTFAFVFKKDDSTDFKPVSQFSQGLHDRLLYNFYPATIDTSGTVTSPRFGPAKAWQQCNWLGQQSPGATQPSSALVHLIGIQPNGSETVLKTFAPNSWNNNISDISAIQYPYLKLVLQTKNAKDALPYQLNRWQLNYEPETDGALTSVSMPNLNKPVLIRNLDSLRIGIAFKNIGRQILAASSATITLTNPLDQRQTIYSTQLKPLQPNDTALLYVATGTSNLPLGRYLVHISVNAAKNPVEQHWFNNDAWFSFQVSDQSLSINNLQFTAVAQGQQALLQWQLPNNVGINRFTLEHKANSNGRFEVLTNLPANLESSPAQYQWVHAKPSVGSNYYRLKVWRKDGSVSYSDVRQVRFANTASISAYPNPFGNEIVVQLPENKRFTIKIIDADGRVIANQAGTGTTRLNTKILPAGAYWLVAASSTEQKIIKILKY